MSEGFSSAHLRLRDRKIEEKHQEDIRKVETKLRNVDAAYKEARKELYDSRQRADRFARRLGFEDLADGEYQLANAEVEETYEQALARLEEKERALERANARIEVLEEDRALWEQQEQGKDLRCSDTCHHEQELSALQARLDDVQNTFARAQERYKKDYAKMKAHLRFIRGDETDARQATQNVLKRRRDIKEETTGGGDADSLKGLLNVEDLDDVMGAGFVAAVDEVDQRRRVQTKDKKPRMPLGDRENTAPRPTFPTRTLTSATTVPTFTLSTPKRKAPRPEIYGQPPAPLDRPSIPLHQPQSPSITVDFPSHSPVILVPDSSIILDTNSSSTAGPSRLPKVEPYEALLPGSPSRTKSSHRNDKDKSRRRSDIGPDARARMPTETTGHPDEPPRKIRRVSDGAPRVRALEGLSPIVKGSPRVKKSPMVKESPTVRGLATVKSEFNDDSKTMQPDNKGKGKAAASTSTAETDYSRYKGRGRYGKERDAADTTLDSAHDTSADTTINAMYEIDRSRNGGADYQFEEVVRGKEARRQLEATDCECCCEYYEAVGPLPSRLQQPLWRSPTKSAARHHPRCGHRDDDDLQAKEDIQAHRQTISRHRQQWARAKTPPSYWEIGFPSTQEAADINERAREMHRDKMRVVDTEARKEGGRYRRR